MGLPALLRREGWKPPRVRDKALAGDAFRERKGIHHSLGCGAEKERQGRMKAADVKCPKCGLGMSDVAPDRDMGTSATDPMSPAWMTDTIGSCPKGHMILVTAIRGESGDDFTVVNLGSY